MRKGKTKPIQWGEEFYVLKAGEGGIGQVQGLRVLRSEGIACRPCHAPYVGHTGIQIARGVSTSKVSRLLWG